MNYYKSSSVFKFGLDCFFPFLLIFLLYYFLIKVHKFGRSGSRHSPPIRGIASFLDGFSVGFFSVSDSIGMDQIMVFFFVILIFFIQRAHPVHPIDSVFLFLLSFSDSFTSIISFDFFCVIMSQLLEIFDLCLEFLVFKL